MKMNIRPVAFLLLIIVLVAGISSGLYSLGLFDSFLSEMDKKQHTQEGEGPVVRKEISNLTLPLQSSSSSVEIPPAEGMLETDISSESSTEIESATVPQKIVPQSNASNTNEAEKAAVENADKKNAEIKSSAVDSAGAKDIKKQSQSKKAKLSKGKVGLLAAKCAEKKFSVQVPISATSGRIKWFNMQNPRRLVVDILGKWSNTGKSVYIYKNCVVNKIVTGEHPDKLRLVFYLDKPGLSKSIAPSVKKDSKKITIGLSF
ncbi:AMIN domain-containing protein [Maridesulfovibrio zosterae]|uniref:AMIN domain-containing protein n=1 Tax=Maridesulfovibrio zosterae TaxID=82171 RepID=UPI00040CC3FD|nr:AMIN domain-containing protein [Maridesulfovibrio zosterae]